MWQGWLLAPVLVWSLAQAPIPDWPLEELHARNGQVYRGLVLDDLPQGVRFRIVNRPPGRPTVTLTTFFERAEVRRIVPLPPMERERLQARLRELDPNGQGERERMQALTLHPADWLGQPNAARRYDSEAFTLVSSASDEITRRAAVRLEQIFAAYARFLPPRLPHRDPTLIVLAPDPAEYAKLVGPAAGPILNPAIYDPRANRIICGSDLRRLGQNLAAARLHNSQQHAALDKYEADLRQLYKTSPAERDRYLALVAEQRRKVIAAERANEAEFQAATRTLFALLYHEAFHAYISTHVYRDPELPRWLNEGLAQIFETAVLDAGELRVGHADRPRLAQAQELAKQGRLVPIAELLQASPEAFLTAHADQKATADRVYLTSWCVAFDLMFERKLLGTPAWDDFIQAGATPAAFRQLVGCDLPEYDRQLRRYITQLQPDGTVRR